MEYLEDHRNIKKYNKVFHNKNMIFFPLLNIIVIVASCMSRYYLSVQLFNNIQYFKHTSVQADFKRCATHHLIMLLNLTISPFLKLESNLISNIKI